MVEPNRALQFDYEDVVDASEQVAWRLDDVITADAKLDFATHFLPQLLAPADDVDGLSPAEALKLNHILGHGYLHLFRFIEEYIIALAVQHAHAELFGDRHAQRALLRFGDEELKHQLMFSRGIEAFDRGFGTRVGGVGSPAQVAQAVLQKSPLAVMLTTLHLELVTQKHFVEAFRVGRAQEVDPTFKRMLQHHWMEETQHAKIDQLELARLGVAADDKARAAAVTDYAAIVGAMDALLAEQTTHDLDALWAAIGRRPSAPSRDRLRAWHHQTYRQLFLLQGLRHDGVISAAQALKSDAPAQLDSLARSLGG